jgi:hypothetical protein
MTDSVTLPTWPLLVMAAGIIAWLVYRWGRHL